MNIISLGKLKLRTGALFVITTSQSYSLFSYEHPDLVLIFISTIKVAMSSAVAGPFTLSVKPLTIENLPPE